MLLIVHLLLMVINLQELELELQQEVIQYLLEEVEPVVPVHAPEMELEVFVQFFQQLHPLVVAQEEM